MRFIGVPTLVGGVVHIAAPRVYRVTSESPVKKMPTQVDFGAENLKTTAAAEEIVAALALAGVRLSPFHTPDGQLVYLNTRAITMIESVDPRDDTPGTEAVVFFGSVRQEVRETPEVVRDAAEGLRD